MQRTHHELKHEVLEIMSSDPLRARRSYRYRPGKLYVSVPGYRVYFRESDTKVGCYESFEFVHLVKHPKTELVFQTAKTLVMMPLFFVLYLTNAVDFFLFSKHGRKKLSDKTADVAKSFVDGRFWGKFMNVRPSALLILFLLFLLTAFAGFTMLERNGFFRRALSREVVAKFLGVDSDKVRILDNGVFAVEGYRITAGDNAREDIDVMFRPEQWLSNDKTPVVIKRYNVGSDGKMYEPTFVSVQKDSPGLLTVNKNDEIVFDARSDGSDHYFDPVKEPNSNKDYATDVARIDKIVGAHVVTEQKGGIAVRDIERNDDPRDDPRAR